MAVKDLVSGILAESIATSTTNILVTIAENIGASGIQAFFPTPPFYITIMPKSPVVGVANRLNSEIIKVTAVGNDQVGNAALTGVRAQRDTTAKAFSAGDIVTVGVYTDDAVLLGGTESTEPETPWIRVSDIIWSQMIDKIYPVGSIFMSATLSTAAAVGNALGGTWTAWGKGKVPVGVNTSETEFNTVEKTGGAKTHTLTVDQMPSHNHDIHLPFNSGVGVANSYGFEYSTSLHNLVQLPNTLNNSGEIRGGNRPTGGGSAHNNLQPYITCYMYKRTA